MKKTVAALLLALAVSFATASPADLKCGKYDGRQLYQGEKGGCYYRVKGKDGKMKRVYVEKKFCKNCK